MTQKPGPAPGPGGRRSGPAMRKGAGGQGGGPVEQRRRAEGESGKGREWERSPRLRARPCEGGRHTSDTTVPTHHTTRRGSPRSLPLRFPPSFLVHLTLLPILAALRRAVECGERRPRRSLDGGSRLSRWKRSGGMVVAGIEARRFR